MPELSATDFRDYYIALWGHVPFRWQQKLAERVLTNGTAPWPEAIALPTASGKTACIDIAVFAVAAQAHRLERGKPLTAPRRIFFVVDRRVIVDEAFDRASKLADKLRTTDVPVLRGVADQLRQLAGSDDPLLCYQLRGGMYRSDAWAHSPVQPAVICSTVDQLGSRLLFRGYGRSFKAWPIQAGLTGNDSLILLDEAHCAQPFLETLRAVNKYRQWGDAIPKTPFNPVVMSATPPDGLDDIFLDDSDEPGTAGHPLGDRQLARKPVEIVSPADHELAEEIKEKLKALKEAKGTNAKRWLRQKLNDLRANAGDKLADVLADKACALMDDRALAAVVFTNRVAVARRTHRLLAEKYGDAAVLLTGRMRSIDKDDVIEQRLAVLSADCSKDRQLAGPMFVVATQTLEVGANLDFDVLVTECASLDALRQRFGRLNRMGRKIETKAAIVVRADQAAKSDDDPVYGASLAETWKWLVKKGGKTKTFDMGIAALAKKLPGRDELMKLNAPSLHAPVMLPSHVDCWVQTAPQPTPTPDVAVFLHGVGRASADVQVCWRADLPPGQEDNWLETLVLCPPSAPECLPVPVATFGRWFGGDSAVDQNDADVEGAAAPADESPEGIGKKLRNVVRWRGRDDSEVINDPNQVHPGDVVVIPAEHGGWDVLGDLTAGLDGHPVIDWGDRAHRLARAKAVLRLRPELMTSFPESPATTQLHNLIGEASQRLEDDPDGLEEDLRKALGALAKDTTAPAWLREIANNLAADRKLTRGLVPHPAGGLVIRGSRRLTARAGEADAFSDEDDTTASSGGRRIGLDAHLLGGSAVCPPFRRGLRLVGAHGSGSGVCSPFP
ncbi:MAG: type I-U CRISPR-associated helicase/endonuclease Cas3 [Pseudomonadota bacterium]|nr:type I-U CRISPR-associated helicase/endonuclease Cas3 [Pseudomonadota bacterium]